MQNKKKKTIVIGRCTEEAWCNIYFLVGWSGEWILYRQILQTVKYKYKTNIKHLCLQKGGLGFCCSLFGFFFKAHFGAELLINTTFWIDKQRNTLSFVISVNLCCLAAQRGLQLWSRGRFVPWAVTQSKAAWRQWSAPVSAVSASLVQSQC